MAHYLLKTEEMYGEQEIFQHHVIEAQDRQMVKYWFHKALKEWGYRDAQYGKHCLENWDLGHICEIYQIQELKPHEWEVLSNYLHKWYKPD